MLRVTVRAPDLDAFITRYSRHIAGDRIFIFSKAPQPVGTQVRFNLQLQTGEVLIQGKGTVKRVQKDDGDARHPPGMEVQFTPLDERSATLVDFMMATRAGLTEPVAASKAPPLVRAVLPKKPVASVLPKLPSKPDTPPPLPPVPSAPLSLVPSAAPSAPLPLVPSAPLLPVSTTMGAPPPSPKTKPTPVARPPSLSLENVWKSEASEEKTFADLLPKTAAPPADSGSPPLMLPDSAPLAVVAAAHKAAAAAATMPPSDSVPTAVGAPPSDAVPPVDPVATPLSPGLASLAGDAAPPTVEPLPASKSQPLPTIIPTTVDPSVNATPVFAESWGGDAPANPFSDVSDGAIEYFVEWSLEQSIGPRALPQAQFSDVPMALPGESGTFDVFDPPTRRQRMIQLGVVFAAGLLVGGVVVALFKRAPVAPPAPIAAVAEPPAAEPPAKPAPAEADAELAVTTRPAGASVSIDGTAAGTTPLTTHLSPGKHEIVVTKERYTAVTTSTDAPGTLTLDLRRPTATLRVTSTPPAADVVIAGEHRGKTPVDVKLPGFESYDVRVGKAWRKKIYLGHSQNHVEAALAATPRAGRR